ncbi:MAG: CBS domain-containing protein, partial [Aggregatilineales bacterium]
MKLILTHQNADFDALASLYGAYLLYPAAIAVLPPRLNRNVAGFLTVHGAAFPFIPWRNFQARVNIDKITQILITDTDKARLPDEIPAKIPVQIIDHHTLDRELQPHESRHYEALGAITTYFVEQLQKRNHLLTSTEATLLALGIYADTGMLTYGATTPRDAYALAYLLSQGANLDDIRRGLATPLDDNQQRLLDDLLDEIETISIQGYSVLIATATRDAHISGLNSVTQVLRNLLAGTALFVLLQTSDTVQLVARSTHDDVDVGAVARSFKGGGHPRAAAATIKAGKLSQVKKQVIGILQDTVRPAIQVRDLMARNPYTVQADDKVMDVLPRLRRIGHEGYPVLQDKKLVGLLNLRDADRSAEHKLKTALIEHIMQKGNVHVRPQTAIDTLERRMAASRWGQIPVLDNDDDMLIGIVTRTDLIRYRALQQQHTEPETPPAPHITSAIIKNILGTDIASLIEHMQKRTDEQGQALYMVGGVVRDLLLKRPNLDIDFVLEGDAIVFAEELQTQYGGHLHTHPPFGTAKWTLDENVAAQLNLDFAEIPDHLDFASARHEFYEHPAALPTVYQGSVRLDAARRDFTINALAVQLSP